MKVIEQFIVESIVQHRLLLH